MRLEGVTSIIKSQADYMQKTLSCPNVSISYNQQLVLLHKITVMSGFTLWAHFSLDIVKFDTLSNLLLTLDTAKYWFRLCMYVCSLQCCDDLCRGLL